MVSLVYLINIPTGSPCCNYHAEYAVVKLPFRDFFQTAKAIKPFINNLE